MLVRRGEEKVKGEVLSLNVVFAEFFSIYFWLFFKWGFFWMILVIFFMKCKGLIFLFRRFSGFLGLFYIFIR